jgi:hypothetical protein
MQILRAPLLLGALLLGGCSSGAADDGAVVNGAALSDTPTEVDITRNADKTAAAALHGTIPGGTPERFASAVEGLAGWSAIKQAQVDNDGHLVPGSAEAPIFKSIALVSDDTAPLASGRTLAVKLTIVAPGPLGDVDVNLQFQVKLVVTDGVLHVDMSNTNSFSKFLVGEILAVGSFTLGYDVRVTADGLAVDGHSTIRLEKQDQLGPRFVQLVQPIFEFIKQGITSGGG